MFIVVYHLDLQSREEIPMVLRYAFNTLWSMVDLFFVLSGFLIANQWFKNIAGNDSIRSLLKAFYIKRFFRIIPLYYLVFMVYVLKEFVIMKRSFDVIPYFFFFQNYIDLKLFTLSWSLCVEEHFYILFPFISLIVFRYAGGKKSVIPFFSFTILACLIGRILFVLNNSEALNVGMDAFGYNDFFTNSIYTRTHFRFDGIMWGVVLAGLKNFHSHVWNVFMKNSKILLIIAVICLSISYGLCSDRYGFYSMTFGFTGLSFGYSLMLLAFFPLKISSNKILGKVIEHVAKLSYPIYLLHYTAFYFADIIYKKIGITKNDSYVDMIFILALIYVMSVAANKFIEGPMLKFRDKLITKF